MIRIALIILTGTALAFAIVGAFLTYYDLWAWVT